MHAETHAGRLSLIFFIETETLHVASRHCGGHHIPQVLELVYRTLIKPANTALWIQSYRVSCQVILCSVL